MDADLVNSACIQIRISVGGYHTCLSRREQGFESPIRNKDQHVAGDSLAVCPYSSVVEHFIRNEKARGSTPRAG